MAKITFVEKAILALLNNSKRKGLKQKERGLIEEGWYFNKDLSSKLKLRPQDVSKIRYSLKELELLEEKKIAPFGKQKVGLTAFRLAQGFRFRAIFLALLDPSRSLDFRAIVQQKLPLSDYLKRNPQEHKEVQEEIGHFHELVNEIQENLATTRGTATKQYLWLYLTKPERVLSSLESLKKICSDQSRQSYRREALLNEATQLLLNNKEAKKTDIGRINHGLQKNKSIDLRNLYRMLQRWTIDEELSQTQIREKILEERKKLVSIQKINTKNHTVLRLDTRKPQGPLWIKNKNTDVSNRFITQHRP